MKNNYCVYKHTSKIDGRSYVGITRVGVEERWKNGYGYKKNIYFWRYIQKYGWDSLTHEILYENLSEEEAIVKEIELIAKWDLTNKEKGFNLDKGGSTNNHFWRGVYCIETKTEYDGTRIAERETGIPATCICACCNGKRKFAGKDNNGQPLHWVYSDEKHLISERIEQLIPKQDNSAITVYDNIGNILAHYYTIADAVKQTGRHISNIRKSCLHQHKTKDNSIWIFDKDFSEEELNRRIEIVNADYMWCKKVYQYNLQGELLNVYTSATEASLATGCNLSEIGQRCKGRGKTSGGFIWSYIPRDFSQQEIQEAQNCCNHQTILQYTFDMKLVKEYVGGYELSKISESKYKNIRAVCNRTSESAYGYVWRFKGETPEQYEADKKYYANKSPAPKNVQIAQLSLNDEVIKVFNNFAELEREGWGRNMVSLCCRGKKDVYRGYKWKYANEVT